MSRDAAPELLIVVGLTGVGKSTVLTEVMRANPAWRLLPNRRELTDRIILPAVQRHRGMPVEPIEDRLERFRLTAAYRDIHAGGMAHALETYLRETDPPIEDASTTLVFDNLRGLAEVSAAADAFSAASFLLLDATPATRLARLVERRDPFDRVAASGGVGDAGATNPRSGATASAPYLERLHAIPDAASVFDLASVAAWAARERVDAADIDRAARIIVEEQRNYDSTAARRHLAGRRPRNRVLALDTDDLNQTEVVQRVLAWLERAR